MYVAFVIWAVFAFHRFLMAPTASRLLPSMALLLCAFYAKQTAIAFLPLLCIGGLLCLRTTKQQLAWLLGAVVMAGLSATLAPPLLWQNSAVGLANGVDFRWAIQRVYWPLLYQHGIVIATWLPCLLLVWLDQKRWLFPTALLSIYALGVGTAAGVKYGSDVNYYNEYLVFAIMVITASLPSVALAWTGQRSVALWFASALLCSYALILLAEDVHALQWGADTVHINDRNLLAVQRYLASRPGGLVADLADNGIGVFLPTRIAFASFDVTGSAAATGHLDLAAVRQAIRSGKICHALTRRSWAIASERGEDERFPYWANPWAAPVLRDLLPLFERDAEFGDLALMRNPVCAIR